MQRVGFVLKVKPERIAEYCTRHQAVWMEMEMEMQEEIGNLVGALFITPCTLRDAERLGVMNNAPTEKKTFKDS